MLGLLWTLQRDMRTAACFSLGFLSRNGWSKELLVSAARIALSDFLVKGEDNETVRFGESMLEVAAVVVVVKVRSMMHDWLCLTFILLMYTQTHDTSESASQA